METPAHICILKKHPKKKDFLTACEVSAVQYAGTDKQTGLQSNMPLTMRCARSLGISVTTSQPVHHGQKVVSFAAGTGRLISRLCELAHDLGQLCIGLLVLKDNGPVSDLALTCILDDPITSSARVVITRTRTSLEEILLD